MPSLSSTLRGQLERTVIAARDVAEEGAWAALQRLAVDKAQAPSHLSPEQRELRVKLRARGRQLGDVLEKNGEQDIYYLHRECAYEYWHQMLFARFLAENQLLMHPDGVAVSLDECEELAVDEGTDGWTLAARYASRMLPQIFRPDDPLLAVTFAPEDKQALEQLLADLPTEVFTAADSLGWVYQFWQTKRKKEVNDSGEKIGADELPAVTQLFTEDYMVKFLLHNTLGAWWAGKRLTADDVANATDEEQLRQAVALPGVELEYLRFVRGEDGQEGSWRPAAGTFDGWPKQAADLKIMDPFCGSGHFVVAAFDLMVRIRMEEEGLSAADACDAVLRDNLHGLEIDIRCTQIAAFALAFAAWTFPQARGFRELPGLHIACTGNAPQSTEEQWIKLAKKGTDIPIPDSKKDAIRNGLTTLHSLFSDASTLGSLIDPSTLSRSLILADYQTLRPFLTAAMTGERLDDDSHEQAVAAQGMVNAAEMLAKEYTLVATNVPFRQSDDLAETLSAFFREYYPDAKSDIATVAFCRLIRMLAKDGTSAVVLPQGVLYKDYYARLRERLFREHSFTTIARLGAGAFREISGEEVKVCLIVSNKCRPSTSQSLVQYEVTDGDAADKEARLPRAASICLPLKEAVVSNRHVLASHTQATTCLLEQAAWYSNGIQTGDYPRFGRCFWEVPALGVKWSLQLSTVKASTPYGGREHCILWERGRGQLVDFIKEKVGEDRVKSWVRGLDCRSHKGVAVSAMGELKATLYCGELFDDNTVVIVPNDESKLAALWAFCSDANYNTLVRQIDQSSKVRGALLRVPYDEAAHLQGTSTLPEPYSDDPTQWLFYGHPVNAISPPKVDVVAPLHVAVTRLLGYRWPAELDEGMRLSERARTMVATCSELTELADTDGIVCLPAVAGERTASDRLGTLLTACGVQSSQTLDAWLRDKFFEEHCQLFHQRPFIWHIWDGRRKDGFHALVNYHKIDRKLLEKLIYSHLGDWIARQKAAESRGESGAEARRLAAEDLQSRLKLILAGEPPYDIFVRWKPLEKQPIGWDPDLNDGVRVNIRPFVDAGVLRKNPKIKWKKDRGKETERPKEQYPWFWGWDEEADDFMGGPDFDGNRWNDCHYSNEVKREARASVEANAVERGQ